jgi:hypothetical protein
MTRHRSFWILIGRIVAVVVLAGVIGYLYIVGLERADKLASVLSLVVAAAALLAPYLLPLGPQSPTPPRTPAMENRQSVGNSVVMGSLTQAKKVANLRASAAPAPANSEAAAPAAVPLPDNASGQYVNGVWVGGHLTQIDGAKGDVTLG